MAVKSRIKSRKRQERLANAATFIILAVLAAAVMLPIWWIFRSSLMSNGELFEWPPSFLPKRWLFSNYAKTLEFYPFWEYFKNTMTIIVPSVIGGTVTATLGGYAFARLRFRGKKFLFTLCVGSMLLPSMVTLIPLFVVWAKLGLVNTYLRLLHASKGLIRMTLHNDSGAVITLTLPIEQEKQHV